MPPSVELVASAWESWGPGLPGRMNGNAVAGAGADGVTLGAGVALAGGAGGAAADPCGANVGVERVLGAWSVTMTADRSPPWPLMTKIAGCCRVAPPTGIIATARWRPG